ncbi:MAG: hypothetical protein PHQ23_14630 [Candidatus Wallbacteria bacterium]|nr:hypothetical protein [Candidatus Wallbacteria bacterium]
MLTDGTVKAIDKELLEELRKMFRVEVDRKSMNFNTAARIMTTMIDKGLIEVDENTGLDDLKRHLLNVAGMVNVAFQEFYGAN